MENPISPVDVFLNNVGILVTLDNWHNVGYGKVIVIYDRDGRVINGYGLEGLLMATEIQQVLTSVSSRWWRCGSVQPWINDGELWLGDSIGGEFRFDMATGSCEREKSAGACSQT